MTTPSLQRYRTSARGVFRVFNKAEYRFYRNLGSPPTEDDAPFDAAASLPFTPAATFTPGAWFLSMSYFNGVLDSGFRQLGRYGETYVRLDIDSALEQADAPPKDPRFSLEVRQGGVIRIIGYHVQRGPLRPTHWAIAVTNDGTDPPVDTPNFPVVPFEAQFVEVLVYDLPAQPHGKTIKVRCQVRRPDGVAFLYNENSVVKSAVASVTGPTAPSSSVQ